MQEPSHLRLADPAEPLDRDRVPPSLRLLHTADWHLGHRLHGHDRAWEHERFLAWLLDQLVAREIDALIVAGDVFETANPPAVALRAFYQAMARARERRPGLDVVVVGGNHDSAARLDAAEPLLRRIGVHVVGGLPRRPSGALDLDRLLVPLHDARGDRVAWCGAVPYLRPADLPSLPATDPTRPWSALAEGVRAVYEEVADAARERLLPGEALVLTGHCQMADTTLTDGSERPIQGGPQNAFPADVFPDDAAYVALGHLHLAQSLARRPNVRYSGSPLPLSLGERGYVHQVVVVELVGESFGGVETLPVPRWVELLRIPGGTAHAPLEDVLAEIASLRPRDPDAPATGAPAPSLYAPTPERHRLGRPYLSVHVALPQPDPSLRRQIEEALSDKAARLIQLSVRYTQSDDALGEQPGVDLSELTPEQVFRSRYRRDRETDPPEPLMATFRDLLEAVRQGEAP